MWGFIIFAIIVIIVAGIMGSNYETKKKAERASSLSLKLQDVSDFTLTKKVDGYGGYYLFAIDEVNEKIGLLTQIESSFISFSDIIGVELIEDGNILTKKSTSRTIGGAILGGVIAGGAGTIVGGLSGNSIQKNKVSTVTVKILVRNLNQPTLSILCFDSKTMTVEHKSSIETEGKMESYIYKLCRKNADDIKDLVSVIIDRVDNKSEPTSIASTSSNSVADELLKLNELKEKGIITESEFSAQKSKILNM